VRAIDLRHPLIFNTNAPPSYQLRKRGHCQKNMPIIFVAIAEIRRDGGLDEAAG